MAARAGNRVLRLAVVASLVLHAVVLFGVFPELIDTARRVVESPVPLIARLMEPAAVPLPPAVPPVAQPEPVVKPKVEKQARIEKPVVAPPKVAAVAPPPEPAPPAPPAPPSVAPAAPSPAPAAPPSPVAAAPAAVQPMAEEQSADRYRMELIAALARMLRDSYPPQARENNWEGDVLLGVVVRANGSVAVSVKRGSSFGVLDEKALAVVRQAAQEVPVPPALRGRESPLKDLLVQYRLTD